MNRRNFIYSLTLGTLGLNFSKLYATKLPTITKPLDPWKAATPEDVISSLYGDKKIIKVTKKIKIKAPKNITLGSRTPLSIVSDIKAKKVIVMQDLNDFSLVCIFNVPKDAIVDYELKIKLPFRRKGKIIVLIEDFSGLLYKNSIDIETMSSGGCEG